MNGFLNQFPYSDFHEMNLDWIIKTIKNMDLKLDNFIDYNKIEFAEPINWSIINQYKTSLIVYDAATEFYYISKQPVPSGIAITNTDYWLAIIPFKIDNRLSTTSINPVQNRVVANAIDETKADIITESHRIDEVITDLNTANSNITQLNDDLDQEAYIREQNDTVLSQRISNIATLTPGSTTGDAELADIRVGANGRTYDNAGDAVRGQFGYLNSEANGGNLVNKMVVGRLNITSYPWTLSSNANSACSDPSVRYFLHRGDTVTCEDFTTKQIYLVSDHIMNNGFNYASGWKSEAITVPFDGYYGVMITDTSAVSDPYDTGLVITTAGYVKNIVEDYYTKNNASAALSTSMANNRRLSAIDGKFILAPELFEIGNIAVADNTLHYQVSGSRIRTRYDVSIALEAGDVISLAGGVFYTIWYDSLGALHTNTWANSLTVNTPGEYKFILRYNSEATIVDINDLLDGFNIKPHNNNAISNVARALDLLRTNKFYDHLLLNKINGTNVTIPLQSIPSIEMSKRLGFDIIEANVKATSDGKYIVTHGTNGNFGDMFEHVDGVTDISNVAINSVTLDYIKENIRFKSLYPKYRTAPASLEEYLKVCKELSMIPLIQVANDSGIVTIANKIMGADNYIAYNSTRSLNSGFIMNVKSYTTKAQIINECLSVGQPFMYFMSNPNAFNDTDLKDIIESVHALGFTIGFQDTYINIDTFVKYINMGFDFCAATWNVNDNDTGAQLLYSKTADLDFNEFVTTGTVSDNVLSLANGQYLRANGESHFLSKVIVYIKFNGTLDVNLMSNTYHGEITSDGKDYIRLSCNGISVVNNAWFTSSGDTTVYDIKAVSYKV